MHVCEWCGESFDASDAYEEFDDEYPCYSYDNFTKSLCGKCAIQAMADRSDGIYFETCEQCGNSFDFAVEETTFSNYVNGISLIDCWRDRILCTDCALVWIDKNVRRQ